MQRSSCSVRRPPHSTAKGCPVIGASQTQLSPTLWMRSPRRNGMASASWTFLSLADVNRQCPSPARRPSMPTFQPRHLLICPRYDATKHGSTIGTMWQLSEGVLSGLWHAQREPRGNAPQHIPRGWQQSCFKWDVQTAAQTMTTHILLPSPALLCCR
jgi:hypothetical protein